MWTRRLKIAACVLCFCALMVGVGKGLRYVLLDDTARYERITLHDFYEQDDIDVLFVGSSHCKLGIVPSILDQALQQNTFNAGTMGQRIDGTLALIKEAARNNDLDHVCMDIYFRVVEYADRNKNEEMTKTYLISDYLRPSANKLTYLLNASSADHYANSFITARRNANKLFDMDHIQALWQRKDTEGYQEYQDRQNLSDRGEQYLGKGYVAYPQTVKDGEFFENTADHLQIEAISSVWKDDLLRVIDFCRKEGIGLTLVTIPMPNFLLASIDNYDAFRTYIHKLSQENDVAYYDFNLCTEAAFPSMEALFMDIDHLNARGAERFSHLLGRFLSGDLTPDELFYDSYADKLSHMPLTVFGVNYDEQQQADGTLIRDCRVVASAPEKLECEITLEKAGGGLSLLQPYSPNTSFRLDADEKGTCVIRYRSIDDPATEYETRLSIP